MPGVFFSDALRKQALAQVRGQMLQSEISRKTASDLVSRVAPQLIGAELQREFATGKAAEQGAERGMRRDVGMTQLEMQKKLWHKQQVMGLIANVAEATGALGSAMIKPDLEKGLGPEEMPTPGEMRADPTRQLAQTITAPGSGAVIGEPKLPSGATLSEVLEKAKPPGEYVTPEERREVAGLPLEQELAEAAGYGGFRGSTGQDLTDEEFQRLAARSLLTEDDEGFGEYEMGRINRLRESLQAAGMLEGR